MKRSLLSLLFVFFGLQVFGQNYTTPNTGVNWNLSELSQNTSALSMSNGYYVLNDSLSIAETDTLQLQPGVQLKIAPDVLVRVYGTFKSVGIQNDSITITAVDTQNPYLGFRFDENSSVAFAYSIITYGGGLKVITPDFSLTNSVVSYHAEGIATGAAVSLSEGSPLIKNNRFIQNNQPAVSWGANEQVTARIINNYLKGNTQSNENRPQLNLGPTGADTLKVIGNKIIGDRDLDMAGGLAVANFIGGEINAVIKNNTIRDNRYGITILGGNATVLIAGNTIEDNDTQGNPQVGGSGISLNSSTDTQEIIIKNNAIRGNLWGITLLGEASANLGDGETNPGGNVFSQNKNNGQVYALYNNTDNTILAKNNCWIEGQTNSLDDAESVIFHQADDSSLGQVIYDPVNCGGLSNPTVKKLDFVLYPNPASKKLNFTQAKKIQSITIYSLLGEALRTETLDNKQKIGRAHV